MNGFEKTRSLTMDSSLWTCVQFAAAGFLFVAFSGCQGPPRECGDELLGLARASVVHALKKDTSRRLIGEFQVDKADSEKGLEIRRFVDEFETAHCVEVSRCLVYEIPRVGWGSSFGASGVYFDYLFFSAEHRLVGITRRLVD